MKQFSDVVISNAQPSRKEKTSNTYANTSECGPPHPVEAQPLEQVLKGIHHATHTGCDKTDSSTQQQGTDGKLNPIHITDTGHMKQRARAKEISPQNGRSRTRDRHWHQASRSQLEEQEFDSQKERRHRSCEGS